MHFTVIFPNNLDQLLAYRISHVPAPVWIAAGYRPGELTDAIPHGAKGAQTSPYLRDIRSSRGPVLQVGAVQELADIELGVAEAMRTSRSAIVLTHDGGHGSDECLRNLVKDLEGHGLSVTVHEDHTERHTTDPTWPAPPRVVPPHPDWH